MQFRPLTSAASPAGSAEGSSLDRATLTKYQLFPDLPSPISPSTSTCSVQTMSGSRSPTFKAHPEWPTSPARPRCPASHLSRASWAPTPSGGSLLPFDPPGPLTWSKGLFKILLASCNFSWSSSKGLQCTQDKVSTLTEAAWGCVISPGPLSSTQDPSPHSLANFQLQPASSHSDLLVLPQTQLSTSSRLLEAPGSLLLGPPHG